MYAHYRCRACQHEWFLKPQPVTCPRCNHVYVDWLNYDKYDWLGDGNNGPVKKEKAHAKAKSNC